MSQNSGGNCRTSPKRIAEKERAAKALKLRKEGKTFEEIAQACGYHDRSGAWNAVRAELRAITRESATELLELSMQRLDALLERVLRSASGKELDLGAIAEARKLISEQAKLTGAGAPTRVQVELPPEQAWELVRGWLRAPTPELVAVLEECGWRRHEARRKGRKIP